MTPAELHDASMSLAERGDEFRKKGEHAHAQAAFAQALDLERRAALNVTEEPSRGIMLRSAAWLALEAEQPREGERLAAIGLSALALSDRIANELRAVMEEARARLHRPMAPPSATSTLTMHLDGPDISHGIADPSVVQPRTAALQAMTYRMTELRERLPFRRRGNPPPAILAQLQQRIRYAAGSVEVQLILGGGSQPELWDRNAKVVNEIAAGLTAMALGDDEALTRLIPDPVYRENFVALARMLRPDGHRVRIVDIVGATLGLSGPVTRLRPAEPKRAGREKSAAEAQILVGEIRAADETVRHNWIKLVTDDDRSHRIYVSEALLEDIVRPFYGQRVQLNVLKKGKRLWLDGSPEEVAAKSVDVQ